MSASRFRHLFVAETGSSFRAYLLWLRVNLAIEAVMLALVGALVGIGAGIGFGYLGTVAAIKELARTHASLTVSAPQTLAVVGIAVVAGLLASVLPARRAVRAAPTEALADV